MSKFNINAQIRLQAPQNLGAVVKNIRSQLQSITATVNLSVPPQTQRQLTSINKTLSTTQNNLKGVNKQTKEVQASITTFGEQAALAGKRFIAFTIAGGSIIKFVGALKSGISSAIDFERQMNKVAQVTESSIKSVAGISKEISRLSKTFGASSTELSKAAITLAQAGLSAEDTRKSLQALAKTDLAPTFDNITNTTEGAIAIFRQFRIQAEDLESTLSSINAVAGKFAVESSDIVAAVRRTGGAFAAAGGSLNELLALFTSVRATTRESAESIATGFRTIFTRMQRLSTQNYLKNLGVDLQDLSGQFVGPYEAVRRLSVALEDLPGTDPRFSQIIEELGGFRQVSKVIPLIKEFGTAQKALNVAVAGSDSLSRDAARAQESLAVQIQKTKEEFAAMVRTMVDSKGFKSIITVLLKLSSALIKVVESLEPLIPIMTILAGIKIGGAIKPFLTGFKAKGGFGLAGGGLVPGVGNRDTVPAALMPGEFVIRKKAVEAIGPSNLAMMNRGGPVVQKFADGKKVKPIYQSGEGGVGQKFGAIFLTNQNKMAQPGLIDSGYFNIPAVRQSKSKKGDIIPGRPAIQAPFVAAGLSSDFAKKFMNYTDKNLVKIISGISKGLVKEIGIKNLVPHTISRDRIANRDGIIGGLFESSINSLGVTSSPDRADFDYPYGLGSLSGNFGSSELSSIPVDAKKSWNRDARKNLKKKITNWYKKRPDLLESTFGKKLVSEQQGITKQGFNIVDSSLYDKLKTKSSSAIITRSDISRVFGVKGNGLTVPQTIKLYNENEDLKNSFDIIETARGGVEFRTKLNKFAGGGEVPALLTPGEFVFDKKSVNRIGTPKLSQLNYADKFASGGLVPRGVGDIRRARRRRLSPEGDLTTQAQYYAKKRTERFGKRFGKTEEDPRIQYYESTPTLLQDITKIPEITKRFRTRYGDMVRSILIAKLLKNPQKEQILNFPPRGARFLGAGMEAMVFGDEKRAYRIARKGVRGLGSQRPQSSAVLQSLRTVDFGDMYGEILPLAQPLDQRLSKKKYADSFSAEVGSMKRHERIKSAILSRMGKEGFDVSESNIARGELHEGNIGIVKGKIKLIDPNIFREHSKGGKVNTMLTPGEFVVDRSSAQRIGGKNLKKMNRGGYFQGGGFVGGGGGFGNLVGAGFALSGISMLVDSFTGLNKTVDQVVSGLGQFLSNTALLTISFRTLNSFVQKTDQKIAASQGRIGVAGEQVSTLRAKRQEFIDPAKAAIFDIKKGKQATRVQQALNNRIRLQQLRAQLTYANYLSRGGKTDISEFGTEENLKKYASQKFMEERLRSVSEKINPRIEKGKVARQGLQDIKNKTKVLNKNIREQENIIKVEEKAIETHQRYAKNVQTASFIVAGAIAAFNTIGTAIEKSGRAALEAGTGGEGLFTTGKALSTAGQFGGIGAQLGAAFGPLGIAIGGVTGGLLGLAKGFFDARKEIENIKSLRQFNESIQKTSRVLDALEKKQTTFATASVQVNRAIQDYLNTLRSSVTTPETRQDILSKSKGELDKFNTYLNIAAKDVNTFDQFINKAGKETFNFVAYLQGISRYDLEQQFRTIIDGNIKARETQRKIIEVQDEYIRQIRDIINVSRAFETVASNMKKFDNNLELLSGLVEGTSSGFRILNESDFIASPGKIFDSKRFNDIVQRDIGRNPLLGGKFSGEATSIGDRLSKDLITSSQLVQDLPDIVFSFRESIKNLDTEGDALQQFLAKIKSAGKGFDSNFITTTISNVVQGLYADETSEEGFIEKLRKEPQAVIDAITSAFDPLSQTGQLIVSSMADEANRRLNFVSKLVDLTNKEIELRNKGVDILGQGEELRARAENRPLNLDLLQGLDIKKQLNILGDDFALLNNPMRIASELMKEQNDLRDSYNKLAKDSIDTDGKLTATIDTQQEKIGRLNSALQFLSDVSGRTAVTMQKIEKEQAKNQFKYDLASKVTFATSPAELGNLERSLFATAQAALTGSIDSVAPQLRGDVLSMLDMIGDIPLGIFGGDRTGTDIKADLIANKLEQIGLPPNEARAIADRQSEELKRQRENLDKQLKLAEDANNALLAMVGQTQNLVKVKNIAAIEGFNRQIVDILKNQQVQRFIGQKNIAAENISNIGSSKFIFEELLSDKKLGKTELTPKENRQRIEAIANQYEQIKSVGEMIKAQESYIGTIEKFRKPQDIISTLIPKRTYETEIGGEIDPRRINARVDISYNDFISSIDEFTKGFDDFTRSTFESQVGDILNTQGYIGQGNIITRANAEETISKALLNTADILERKFIDVNREIDNLGTLFEKLGGMSQSDIIKISGGISGLDESLKRIVVNGSIPDFGKQIVDLEKDIEGINKKLFEVHAKDKVGPSRKSLLASEAAFASGGFVHGSGSGDKVNAKLAPGEFVLSRKMVQDIGKENVFQMARGGSVRKFTPKTEEEAKREYERKRKLSQEKWAKYEKENENKRWINTDPLPTTIRKPLPDRFLPARGSDPYHTSRLIPDMDLGLKDRTQLRKRRPSDIAGDREFARIQKKQKETERLGYDLARLENIKRRKERQKENETLNQRYAERTKQAERIKSRDLTERRYDSEQHDKDTYNREAKIRNQPTQDLIKDRINREKIEAEKQASIQAFRDSLSTPKRYEISEKDFPRNLFSSLSPGESGPISKEADEKRKRIAEANKKAFEQADKRAIGYQIARDIRQKELSSMSEEEKIADRKRQDEFAKKTYKQNFSQADVRRVQDKAYQENLQEVERNRIQFYKQTVKKEKRSGILGVAKDFADLYSIGRKGADVVVPGLGTAADIAGVGTLTGMGIGAAGSLATRVPGVTRGIGAIKRGTNAITGSKYVKPAYNQLRGINIQSGRLGERINTRIAKGAESIVNFPGKLLSKTGKQIKRAYDSTGAGLSNITNELKGRAIARNIPRNIIDKSAVTQKVSQAGRSPFVTKTKMRFPAVAEEIKSPTIAKQPIIEPKKIPRIQKLRKLAKQRQLRKEEIMQDLGGYAKRENISENLLPLQHRRQINLSDNALQNIIKRGKLSKRTVGAATDKQIFLSEKLSPSRQLDIARHESIHILQERLRNFNHPIVQEKLSKFLKPFKKELLKLGYDPKRLNNKEAMAYILQQGNKIPKELRDMIGFQSGSFVSGYGSGDKVPALLEPGEFVLNRNAVSKIGAGKLTDLNTKYNRKGYQEGGAVTTTQTSPSMNMEPFLQFSKAMEGIVNKMESVANILNGLSLQHTFNGTVTVQIVGGQFMGQISKEMQAICNAEIKKVLGNFASKKLNIDNID